MNDKTFLIITSIAQADNKVLGIYSNACKAHNVNFIVIGDSKSPAGFKLAHTNYFSLESQKLLPFRLAVSLPEGIYARKNIGYLLALSQGADIIIETDDDNYPYNAFWDERHSIVKASVINNSGWVNAYQFFSKTNIWPRGFALEQLNKPPVIPGQVLETVNCPIQQGLADDNPDVDAIYRLTAQMPVKFECSNNIALANNTWCPFNSQNTTWFKKAFPLMYLPTHCSFRMTDIWRSFVAQRIAWTNNWHVLFHNATVYQDRNEHNLLIDFKDEIPGYLNNGLLCEELQKLDLKSGENHLFDNMRKCYHVFINLQLVAPEEQLLLDAWISDCSEHM